MLTTHKHSSIICNAWRIFNWLQWVNFLQQIFWRHPVQTCGGGMVWIFYANYVLHTETLVIVWIFRWYFLSSLPHPRAMQLNIYRVGFSGVSFSLFISTHIWNVYWSQSQTRDILFSFQLKFIVHPRIPFSFSHRFHFNVSFFLSFWIYIIALLMCASLYTKSKVGRIVIFADTLKYSTFICHEWWKVELLSSKLVLTWYSWWQY